MMKKYKENYWCMELELVPIITMIKSENTWIRESKYKFLKTVCCIMIFKHWYIF